MDTTKQAAEAADPSRLPADEVLRRAVEHHRAGRLHESERLYRSVLGSLPNDADANHNLGVLLAQIGQPRAALPFLKSALASNPAGVPYWISCIKVLSAAGLAEEAAKILLVAKGNGLQGAEIDQLEASLPPPGPGTARPAQAMMSRAEKEAAVRALLGGDFAGADRLALALTQIHPLDAFGWKLLGAARVEMERPADALAAWTRAVQLAPGDAEAHNNLGSLHNRLGNLGEAEACLRAALAIKPDYVEALNNLGGLLNILGRRADARASYEAALRLKPDHAACHENLGRLKTFAPGDPQLQILQALHATVGNESDRKFICFALAKACEDLEDYDRAFALYSEGNALRKKELGYTIDRDRKTFAWIKSTFRALPDAAALPRASPTPILVVGMPRSGTSLAEQILASHSEVLGGGELEFLSTQVRRHAPPGSGADFDLAAASRSIAADYLEELNSIGPRHRFFTDKMPLNFRWLGFLLLARPDVKVIHTVRDPAAVCWSNFRQNFSARDLGFANDLADLVEYQRLHDDLMRFWRGRFPGRIYELNYERLTECQEEETRKLLAYCGLPWEDRCLEFEKTKRAIRTASVVQVRTKMYKGSSAAWRRYQRHLEPVLGGLGSCESAGNQPSPRTIERP